MKKTLISLFLFLTPLLSCSSSSNTSTKSYSESDLTTLKKTYGTFSITRGDGGNNNASYNEETNTYTIPVEETKAEYVLQGYSDARFVFANPNSVADYKGIKINLNKACIVSNSTSSVFYYSLGSKNIEVGAKKNTENILLNIGEGNVIDSQANIELTGKGSLELFSKGATSGGHTVRASNSISLYESVNLTINSGHDGLHCDSIYTYNNDDTTNKYTGTIRFGKIVSQAMEATTSQCEGLIKLTSGTFVIDNCDSVFKSDISISISSGVSVKASSTTSNPVVKQDKDEVDENVTIPSLKLENSGTFIANGETIESQTF